MLGRGWFVVIAGGKKLPQPTVTFFEHRSVGPRWKDPMDLAFIRRFLDQGTANGYEVHNGYTREEVSKNGAMSCHVGSPGDAGVPW